MAEPTEESTSLAVSGPSAAVDPKVVISLPLVPSSGASVMRSDVAPQNEYGNYKEDLRYDFWYSCAYCTITEAEASAIGFEIDHYVPTTKNGDLKCTYSNLNWSCEICNLRKSDHVPNAALVAKGMRFFRPDFDAMGDTYEVDGVRLKPKSPVGVYTDTMLDMNREGLRELRRIRSDIEGSVDEIMEGLRALRDIPIDTLPVEVRARVVEVRGDLLQQAKEIPTDLNDLLRELCKSAYKDPDAGKAEWSKRRRTFLEEKGALSADPWKAPHKQVAVAAKKATKRSDARGRRGKKSP